MIHLPAAERDTICRAWLIAEEHADKTAALTLSVALLAWLRSELTCAALTVTTANLNRVIAVSKSIIADNPHLPVIGCQLNLTPKG